MLRGVRVGYVGWCVLVRVGSPSTVGLDMRPAERCDDDSSRLQIGGCDFYS